MAKKEAPSVLEAFPAPLREALAVHEALRKLGFSASQIYMHRNQAPRFDVLVVLKHLGKSLNVVVGVLPDDDWMEQWTRLVQLFNSNQISGPEFQEWYGKSWAGSHHVELLAVMEMKGISPPLSKQ